MTDKKSKAEEKAAERREERLAEQGQADAKPQQQDTKDQANAQRQQSTQDQAEVQQQDTQNTEDRVLGEDEAPANPVEQSTLTANYDPTGQIEQPGMPLHSTDPGEQAAYEEQRREAIRRSQMGEGLPEEEAAVSDEENRENA